MKRAVNAWAPLLFVWASCACAQGVPPPPAPDDEAIEESGESAPPSEEEVQAKAAYAAGVQHFKAKRYADAIREFNKAFRVDPNPVLVFNMARAFEELNEYDSAIEFYRRYLEMAPDADDAPTVADALRALVLLREREGVTVSVSVTTQPDGARVYVDGREVGTSPLRLALPVGRHFVAAEREGYTRASREIELVEGKPVDHALTLVPVAEPPRAETGGNTTGWVLVGVGGALLAGAAITGALALGKNSELDDLDGDAGNTSRSEYDSIQEEGRTLALTTDGLLLGGAASVLTGGFLLLTGGDADVAPDPLNAPSGPARTYQFPR